MRVLALITELRAIWEAKAEPKLLCCGRWNEYHESIANIVFVPQMLGLANLYLAPIYARMFDPELYTYLQPTRKEQLILGVYAVALLLATCILVFLIEQSLASLCCKTRLKAKKASLRNKLQAVPKMEYPWIKYAHKACGLCFTEFRKSDSIVRLCCKEKDVFHRWCLSQQLRTHDPYGRLNHCVLCGGKLRFELIGDRSVEYKFTK